GLCTGRLPGVALPGDRAAGPRPPAALAAIVRQCVPEDPDDGPQNMHSVLNALRQLSTPVDSRTAERSIRKPHWILLFAAMAALLAGAPFVKQALQLAPAAPVLAEGIAAPLAVAPLSNQTGDASLD